MASDASQLTTISTNDAPAAIGPYAQGQVVNGLIFTAGQIPLDPQTMKVVEGGINEQTRQVMTNLQAVVTAGGGSLGTVVKTTCFLANLDDFPAFNAIYGEFFGEHKPARSTVQVAKLPLGVLVAG